jgi:hypothetical protein
MRQRSESKSVIKSMIGVALTNGRIALKMVCQRRPIRRYPFLVDPAGNLCVRQVERIVG